MVIASHEIAPISLKATLGDQIVRPYSEKRLESPIQASLSLEKISKSLSTHGILRYGVFTMKISKSEKCAQ